MSMKQTFSTAASETVQSLGDRLFKLAVFFGDEKIYVSPAAAATLTDSVSRSLGSSVADFFKRNGHAVAAANTTHINGQSIHRIGINPVPRNNARIVVSEKFPLQIEYTSLFDHELGHILVPGGLDGKVPENRREGAANAFMALRHLQRYGTTTDMHVKSMTNQATMLILHGVISHYTPAVFDKAVNVADVRKMTMRQTVETAAKIAAAYTLPEAVGKKIYDAFAPLRRALVASGNVMNNATYKTACDIIAAHKHDGQICRAGYHFIRQFNQPIPPGLMTGIEMNAATAVDRSTPPPSSGLKGTLLNIFKKF